MLRFEVLLLCAGLPALPGVLADEAQLKDEAQPALNLASKGILGSLMGGSSGTPAASPGPIGPTKSMPGNPTWPMNRQDYVPPFTKYVFELKNLLETWDKQWVVAAGVGALGIVNVAFSQAAFRIVVTLGFSLVTVASTHYEVTMLWPGLDKPAQIFIAAEVTLLTAWIVYQSFVGAKTILGFLLGIFISALLEHSLHTEQWPASYSVAWYSGWAIIGVLSLTTFEKYTMAVLTPILGGFLLASSIGYLIMYSMMQAKGHPNWVHIHGYCWLDFASSLLVSQKPAGIFGTIQTPGFLVPSVDIDKVLGRLLWFAIFYTGAKWQWYLAKKPEKKK